MGHPVEMTIDGSGKIEIPSEVREKAGLKPGTPLQVTFRDGHVEIEPLPQSVRVARREDLSVAEREEEESEPLTNEQVLRTLDEIRRERGK